MTWIMLILILEKEKKPPLKIFNVFMCHEYNLIFKSLEMIIVIIIRKTWNEPNYSLCHFFLNICLQNASHVSQL